MKQTIGLLFALLIGIAIGAWGAPALNAQTAGTATYVVAEMHVTDPAGFTEYMRRESATLTAFHGRVAARGLPDTREGPAPDGVVTIYAFNNPQDAGHWYISPDYAKLLTLRQHSATSRVWFLTGVAAQ
jgi:uncharacterized protein (DUF1330 family)